MPAIEAGSWFLARVQLEDASAEAAVVAADAVARSPRDSQTAQDAYAVAKQELSRSHNGEIDPATFRLSEDGTIRFTAQRTAPSLLLGHLDWAKDMMVVSAEVEAARSTAPPARPHHRTAEIPRRTHDRLHPGQPARGRAERAAKREAVGCQG